ncbi:MFS transporter [Candidatus Dojkabacteria bacterium]|nr:MFS transporter [Candidatus Dojkabacteria bacterium]
MNHNKHFFGKFQKLQLNKIIQTLTYSDSFVWGGYNMMNTVVAIYLEHKIAVNPLEAIAFGFSIFMFSRSVFQIPIAQFLDKQKSYIDESVAIFLGACLMSLGIFSFRFIIFPWQLYFIQFLIGLGTSINLPAWRKTFANFVDKGHEGVEYSLYDVIICISIAFFSSAGGYIVSKTQNFELLFTLSAILIFIGGIISLFLLRSRKISS